MSNCPHCGSGEIERARRRGPMETARALLGYWPYRCWHCEARFYSRGRQPCSEPETRDGGWEPGRTSGSPAAAMAFRTHPRDPMAKVLITAETSEQLDKILLALEHAVSSYGQTSKTGAEAPAGKPG